MPAELLSECPLCRATEFRPFLTCQDHTTSAEYFNLVECTRCSFVLTNPRPDRTSIGKYYESKKYISHTGESSGIIDSIYLLARNYTLRWKIKLIQKFSKPSAILDFGCGTGEFLRACDAAGWKAYGVEPSGAAWTKATTQNNVSIFRSIEELPNAKFQIITLWHVLEHIEDLAEKVDQLKSHLADDGTLFVAVPNHMSYDAAYYKQHWAAYDVPRHLWHFSAQNITLLMSAANLRIVKIKPMKLDAWYISLLSAKYKSGKFTFAGILTAAYTALLSNLKARKDTNFSSLIYIIKK